MTPDEIRERVARLGNRSSQDAEAAWGELRSLREAVVPYLVERYHRARRGEQRVPLVFYALHLARTSDAAFDLGLAARKDRSALVRYRACGLTPTRGRSRTRGLRSTRSNIATITSSSTDTTAGA